MWGFPPRKVKRLKANIDEIMERIGLAESSMTTIVPAIAESCGREFKTPEPYLVIRSSDIVEMRDVLVALSENGVHVNVELQRLEGFYNQAQMKNLGR
jgi:hypothetical protein